MKKRYLITVTVFLFSLTFLLSNASIFAESSDNTKDAEFYNSQGIYYGKQGMSHIAITSFDKAIELKPDYADAYSNRGFANFGLKNFNQTIVDCSKAIEFNPKLASAYYTRALAYDEKGDFEHAVLDYSAAIEINPSDAASLTNRGLAYGMLGNSEQALADLNKAIEIRPQLAAAYNNRALIYLYKKEYNKSWNDVHKAESLGMKPNKQILGILKQESGRED